MIRTVEAVVDERGHIRLLEAIELRVACRAFVTILDEPPAGMHKTASLSEAALVADWDRPEEEEAWAYLQPVR